MVNITLPPEVGGERNASPDTPPPDQFIESMLAVIDSPNGIEIETTSPAAAEALRFRYYQARKRQKKLGNQSFDGLIFKLSGAKLLILPPLKIISTKEL